MVCMPTPTAENIVNRQAQSAAVTDEVPPSPRVLLRLSHKSGVDARAMESDGEIVVLKRE